MELAHLKQAPGVGKEKVPRVCIEYVLVHTRTYSTLLRVCMMHDVCVKDCQRGGGAVGISLYNIVLHPVRWGKDGRCRYGREIVVSVLSGHEGRVLYST